MKWDEVGPVAQDIGAHSEVHPDPYTLHATGLCPVGQNRLMSTSQQKVY